MELDTQPRVVAIPKELADALKKDKKAQVTFGKLLYTHQKEYVTWIEEAKKDETRWRRLAKTFKMLKEGE